MLTRNKIRGMLVGGAIGDAYGVPVECFSKEEIAKIYPEGLKGYCSPPLEHKFFTADPEDLSKSFIEAGQTTDDTQLTVATAKSLIECKDLDMDSQSKYHVMAFEESILGYGRTTLNAVRKLADGVDWRESGKSLNPDQGQGNGIPMKCSPVGAWMASQYGNAKTDEIYQKLVDYGGMTHYTANAVLSGIIHCEAIMHLLWSDLERFDAEVFLYEICVEKLAAALPFVDGLKEIDVSLKDQMEKLWKVHRDLPYWSVDKIREEFGYGSPFVCHSLPFSYAMFYQNPYSLETITKTVHAGGDTDTNAKIVAEMIGALHGIEVFQHPDYSWMFEGLQSYNELLSLADKFSDVFKIH